MDYIRVPEQITDRSMEIIAQYTAGLALGPVEEAIYRRIIHTTGDPAVIPVVSCTEEFVGAVFARFGRGDFVIFTDVNMIKAGINGRRVTELGGKVVCRIADAAVTEQARRQGDTRAMTAVRMSREIIKDNIVVIGNAPTALFTVLEIARAGCRPAAIVGTPVGFVGAKESKELLGSTDIPHITIRGTRGGSTIAAAVVNALLYSYPGEGGVR